MDWFSERRKWSVRLRQARLQSYPAIPAFDARSRELFETALPRGVLAARLDPDRERINYWMSPTELLKYRFQLGQLLLGKLNGTFLGHLDDRPMVTIAGARAGKTKTVLEPNLFLYSGSMLALDPKGELAEAARYRRAMGHNVYVLDPFGQSGEPCACFNPLDELDPDDLAIVDDVGEVAAALIPDNGDERSRHWRDSARMLLICLILFTLTLDKSERNLITVRELLCLTYKPLAQAVRAAERQALAAASDHDKQRYFDSNKTAIKALFNRMVDAGSKFGGVLASIANRFLQTPDNERGSFFSTAAAHTDFLDSLLLRRTLRHSDFRLATLRSDKPPTIFLCLPVGRMQRHSGWLRLIVQLACVTLERMGPYPLGRLPILFMMEEFATLGRMDFMEYAAAYFPGFGIKLWIVLQNLTQLQTHYPTSWETFLGNAGLVQLFSNGDGETLDYVSRHLEKLIAPFELRTAFSRQRNSQLLLMEGQPPAAALRLDHADVDAIRNHAMMALRAGRMPFLGLGLEGI